MRSSDPAGSRPPSGQRRGGYGPLAWTVFILAVVAVLVLLGGCLSVLYGPIATGG